MAVDEALAEGVRAGSEPFLRFYLWSPATLSLGRFQNPTDGLSEEALRVPRVRRMTGGGGIWHANELTYSLGCTQEDLGTLGVKPSFERLCGFLLDTWRRLGWDADFAKDRIVDATSLGRYAPACFAGSEEYDILVAGKKLGGNAQRRDRKGIFQHGSLPLELDWAQLRALFREGYRPDPALTTDLRSCGWSGSALDLIPLLADSFQTRMAVEWRESGLSEDESARAATLTQEQFASENWTENGGGSLRSP